MGCGGSKSRCFLRSPWESSNKMVERLIIAGAGGQGIMLLGKVFAEAAMEEGRQVTWMPAYGAEVRGGTAYCMVVVADTAIASPRIERADTLIVMNAPSWERFHRRLKPRGLGIFNSSLIEDPPTTSRVRSYPFTETALRLGNARVANMVALGVYIAARGTVGVSSVLAAIAAVAPADKRALVAINQRAVQEGMHMASRKGKR